MPMLAIPLTSMTNMLFTPDTFAGHTPHYPPLTSGSSSPATVCGAQPNSARAAPSLFYETAPYAVPPALKPRRRSYSLSHRPSVTAPTSAYTVARLVTEGDDPLDPTCEEQRRKLSPIGSRRTVRLPSLPLVQPVPLSPSTPSWYQDPSCSPELHSSTSPSPHQIMCSGRTRAPRIDRTMSRPASAPPFIHRPVSTSFAPRAPPGLPPPLRIEVIEVTDLTRPDYGMPDLARLLLVDPGSPSVNVADPELESKFVSLPQLRERPEKKRGPFARSVDSLQELRPRYGSLTCPYVECIDTRCATCVYLRRRGSIFQTKIQKRYADWRLWQLNTCGKEWPYTDERAKLQALQASYRLGREQALRALR